MIDLLSYSNENILFHFMIHYLIKNNYNCCDKTIKINSIRSIKFYIFNEN